MTPRVRSLLSHRSKKDKIGIAIDCELCPVGDLNIVSLLVREGYLVWLDRTVLQHVVAIGEHGARVNVAVEVYQLTPKGVALCDRHGIKQR